MIVNFYNNSSDKADVHKSISHIIDFDCDVFNDCSIQNPQLIVPMSDALINANYCYIAKFKRYYYIVDSTIYNGDMLRVILKSDVLMSFWKVCSGSRVIAKRSQSHPNPNIPDNYDVYKSQSKFVRRKDTNKFTPTANGGCYILTLGGK